MHYLEPAQRIPIQKHMEVFRRQHTSGLLLSVCDESRCNAATRFSNTITARRRVSDIRREGMWWLTQLGSLWMWLKE